MSQTSEVATAKFMGGFNCAQAVLNAYTDELNLDKNIALKLACGFGAGMGRNQEVCGAVTGGILAIGAKFGRDENGSGADTESTYAKTAELMTRFKEKHGSCLCRELLNGCELATAAGQQEFKDKELKKNICTPCVQTVTTILDQILRP